MENSSYLAELKAKSTELAKNAVRNSVNADLFIINAINNVEELQKSANTLTKRLREWYSLYFPELDKKISDNEGFVRVMLKEEKSKLMKEMGLTITMGADIGKADLEPIFSLAKAIEHLVAEKAELETYLEKAMNAHCPNITFIAGAHIGAKLFREAGSLKRMAMMRSSTIQLLGAEKALFRHIRTGARPPKYGYLFQHKMVQKAKREDKGKVARALADKLFIAARLDYFKGDFQGDKLLHEVEVRFG